MSKVDDDAFDAFKAFVGVVLGIFGLICIGSTLGSYTIRSEYREKEKQGLVEYYDELNQKWLWKQRGK